MKLIIFALLLAVLCAANDYYRILEISNNATVEEIKIAYRRATKKFRSDLLQYEEDRQRAEAYARAYSVLIDAQMRHVYDTKGEAGLQEYEAKLKDPNIFFDSKNGFKFHFGGEDFPNHIGKEAKTRDNNLYQILGIENSATQQIKKAYRKLAIKFMPDKVNADENLYKKIHHGM